MNAYLRHIPAALMALIVLAFLWHGPIPQLDDYHHFADSRMFFSIPNFSDVISNLAFLLIGAYGLIELRRLTRQRPDAASRYGYWLLCIGLLLTALGSSYYHWSPDNWHLLWDRLPIALVCAALISAVRAELGITRHPVLDLSLWTAFALFSVAWWYWTESLGRDDLRPYLLLQLAAILLIPLWQYLHHAPPAHRRRLALALALYVLAKIFEIFDHQLFDWLHFVSGHTLKHLFAAWGAYIIVTGINRS